MPPSFSISLYTLFNLSSLTDSVTKIIKLASAYLTGSDKFYLSNVGRIYGEYSLNTNTVRNTATVNVSETPLPLRAIIVPSKT